ncbi:beta-microseminoprotein-like isoform X2 [Dendropsophus ebraccatus]|uniref:beta-microseminoprotein-like isoform X2 n=1 Tax=Dendropsophus ebraccatus TaxID=150705 RepID=UPI0038312920
MTFILHVVGALGFFVILCHSDCNWQKNTLTRGAKGGCLRDGKLQNYTSKWSTDNCEQCTCYKFGIKCCTQDAILVGFNPRMCKAIKVNCTYKVVRKRDPSIPCAFKLLELDSDSSDNSEGTSSDEIDMKEYLKLLSQYENNEDCDKTIEDCEENIEEEEEEEEEENKKRSKLNDILK